MKIFRMLGPSSGQQEKQNKILMGRLVVLVMELVSAVIAVPSPWITADAFRSPRAQLHVILVVARERRRQRFS